MGNRALVVKAALAVGAAALLGGCFLFGGGGPGDNLPVVYVSTGGSDHNSGESPDDPLRSLAVAVRAVGDGGTIKMAAGFYSVEETADFGGNLTIEGGYDSDFTRIAYDPSDIDGAQNELSRLFMRDAYGRAIQIYSAPHGDAPFEVSVSGISIGSAFFNHSGAALCVDGRVNLTLTNCVFNDNYANSSSGALYLGDGGTTTITNCSFTWNSGYYAPSTIYADDNALTIVGSTFTHNSSRVAGSSDAVIYLTSESDHSVSFENCVFEHNIGVPLQLAGTATKIDLGGNVGFAPPIEEITAVFTGWTTGVAQATTIVEGPTSEDGQTTIVMENSDGSIRITSVINDSTGEGTYTYEFTDYTYDAYTYNGTITASVSGTPAPTSFDYDGTLTVAGSEVESIEYDYSFDGGSISGTITINDEYVYDLNDDLGL